MNCMVWGFHSDVLIVLQRQRLPVHLLIAALHRYLSLTVQVRGPTGFLCRGCALGGVVGRWRRNRFR